MAEQTQTAETEGQPKRRRTKKQEEPKAPKLVEYVVLRLLTLKGASKFSDVYNLPGDEPAEPLHAALQQGVWLPMMEQDGEKWRVRRIPAPDQARAIEIVTGKAEEAQQGTWRAVSWSAWKGVTTVEPPRQVMLDVRAVAEEE